MGIAQRQLLKSRRGELQALQRGIECRRATVAQPRDRYPNRVVAGQHVLRNHAEMALAVQHLHAGFARAQVIRLRSAHRPRRPAPARALAGGHGAVKPGQLGAQNHRQPVPEACAQRPAGGATGARWPARNNTSPWMAASDSGVWRELRSQQLFDALLAVGRGPVLGDEVGIVGRVDALVGRGQPAALLGLGAGGLGIAWRGGLGGGCRGGALTEATPVSTTTAAEAVTVAGCIRRLAGVPKRASGSRRRESACVQS